MRWRSRPPRHVFDHRGLANVDSEFEEFSLILGAPRVDWPGSCRGDSSDASSHGGYPQTDLLGGHWPVPIKSFASSGDPGAALKQLRKLLKKQGFVPAVIVTDKLGLYGAALCTIGFSGRHEQGLRANNWAENSRSLTDYGRAWREGERIATANIESTVNQLINQRMCKKRQMRWSRLGAQLMLHVRTAHLNGILERYCGLPQPAAWTWPTDNAFRQAA